MLKNRGQNSTMLEKRGVNILHPNPKVEVKILHRLKKRGQKGRYPKYSEYPPPPPPPPPPPGGRVLYIIVLWLRVTDAAHDIGMRFLRLLLLKNVNPNTVISMILLSLFLPPNSHGVSFWKRITPNCSAHAPMPCPVNDRILLILYSLEMCINNVTHRQ